MSDFFRRWRNRHPSELLVFGKRLYVILYFPHSHWPHLLFKRYPAGWVDEQWAKLEPYRDRR